MVNSCTALYVSSQHRKTLNAILNLDLLRSRDKATLIGYIVNVICRILLGTSLEAVLLSLKRLAVSESPSLSLLPRRGCRLASGPSNKTLRQSYLNHLCGEPTPRSDQSRSHKSQVPIMDHVQVLMNRSNRSDYASAANESANPLDGMQCLVT